MASEQKKNCASGAACPFVVDPDDCYRYVCLKCGLEGSLKKKEMPKKQDLDPLTIIITLGLVFLGVVALMNISQPPTPDSLQLPGQTSR